MPQRIARLGRGWVPEDRRVFTHLTAAENLEVGRQKPCEGAELDGRVALRALSQPRRARRAVGRGLAVLFSEQNLHFARLVADRATITEKGRIRYTGTMKDLSRDREIQKEYLSA